MSKIIEVEPCVEYMIQVNRDIFCGQNNNENCKLRHGLMARKYLKLENLALFYCYLW